LAIVVDGKADVVWFTGSVREEPNALLFVADVAARRVSGLGARRHGGDRSDGQQGDQGHEEFVGHALVDGPAAVFIPRSAWRFTNGW
jgi:hypothetical protein